jgi:glycosyltransferase involved in cell wall biosynthesis
VGVDVTIIVNGHNEGLLAAPSIRSANACRSVAERAGATVETLCVLDRPDQETTEQFRFSSDERVRTIEVQQGDIGLARNAGVSVASGDWIAFLDADDLWAENWIIAALKSAQNFGRHAIWHSEVNILFGAVEGFFYHPDMEDERFDPAALAVVNHWTALCFAPREVLLDIPYRANDWPAGIGPEDWAWNVEAISRGLLHKVVPNTVHAIRKKTDGLNQLAVKKNALPHLPSLHRDMLLQRAHSPRLPDSA